VVKSGLTEDNWTDFEEIRSYGSTAYRAVGVSSKYSNQLS